MRMPATSIFVQPEALVPPADRRDQSGAALGAAARTLAGLTAPTGRCDSTAAVEAAVDVLRAVVAQVSAAAHADALGLRAAAEGYAAAERRASGY